MKENKELLDLKIQEEGSKVLAKILDALKFIKFGYVTLTVQNSKVVQIDKTEKIRLDK